MLDNLAKTITEVVRFTNIHRIDVEFYIHTVHELQNDDDNEGRNWAKFEKRPGVYCIFDHLGKDTKYIGMSKSDTGNRLFHWLFKPNKINEALDAKDVILSIVLEKQPYMAEALETYLITQVETLLNVKKLK